MLGLGAIGLVNYAKFANADINPNPTESPTTSTTVNLFSPDLLLAVNNDKQSFMDWYTYISLNSYGIANLFAGITEIIPSKFSAVRKIANMATGGCLISSGVAMGINYDFSNAYAVPTIVAGASEIIHDLLPMETINNIEEMQETTFTSENARLINDVMDRVHPVFRPTTYDSL